MIDHFRFDKGGISRKPSRYYLAYGSNLDMERMGHRCPYAVPVGVTEIYGYRLLFKKSKTGCYATIEQDANESVPAVVWLLSEFDELLLDRYANVSDIKNLLGDELVASAIKSAMSELDPEEVTNRTKVEPLAQQKLAESLNQKYGEGAVYINKVVINDMDFEEAYNAAIQQKSIAQQNAAKQKIENEADIAKAEADKQVAITKAEAEAQKTSIAADAQAEANRKIAESLSDTLIEYQKIQKWDGKLPTVSGGNALVSIDPAE